MRLRSAVQLGVFCAWAAAVGVPTAHADSITVTGGSYNGVSGVFTLEGSGFSVTAADGFPSKPCQPCTPTQTNQLVLSVNLVENPFLDGATGVFNGVAYAHTYVHGVLTFTAPSVNPSQISPTNVTFTEPFSLTGHLVGFSDQTDSQRYLSSGVANNAFFNGDVNGSGHVTLTLAPNPPPPAGLPQVYDTGSLVYRFEQTSPAATPEPATLLLLGVGFAAAGRRMLKRRA